MITDEELLAQIEQGILADEPITKTLRALLLLGGRLNSGKLGEWAKRELDGYYGIGDSDVPTMRTVGAPIFINAMVGNWQISGQAVSASALPSPFRDALTDDVIFRQSVSEIESLVTGARQADSTFITLSIPNWEAIGRALDKDVFGQHTTLIYRTISLSYLEAIVADVGNRAAELLGEFRLKSNLGRGHELPRGSKADDIVTGVVVTGDNNSVVLASGKSKMISSATGDQVSPASAGKGGWWDAWGKAAAIIGALVGVVTIVVIVYVTVSTGTIPPP